LECNTQTLTKNTLGKLSKCKPFSHSTDTSKR